MLKYFILILVLFSGCAIPDQELTIGVQPQLIEQYPLPTLPATVRAPEFRLITRLFLSEKGDILSVQLLNSSWDPEWDSAAVKQLYRWKFSPAMYNDKPVQVWIRQPILIKSTNQMIIYLAEIISDDKNKVDTIVNLLKNGAKFELIAEKYSIAQSKQDKGLLGRVDIRMFQFQIQNELRKLRPNEVSDPLKIGNRYYIYKRLAEN